MIKLLLIFSALFFVLGFSEVIKDALTVLGSKAITANEDGTGKAIGPTGLVKGVLTVTAVSGTSPTLDIKIQESDDDSTYTDVPGGAFPQMTATGQKFIFFKATKKYLRYNAVVGGTTPSFTSEILITDAP